MNSETYGLQNTTRVCVRPPRSHLSAHRRTTTRAGFAEVLRRRRHRVVHPWCEHCGTTHRDGVVAAECVRLLVSRPD